MESLDLAGVHFSSSKPPNPTWMAHGSERGGALVIDGAMHLGATAPEHLTKVTPRVLALDVPLGVPAGLARALVPVATTGTQVIEHLATHATPMLDTVWAHFAAEHPGALRLTETLTHGAPSMTAPRPPSWRALRGVAQLLWTLRERVKVLPFDTMELSPAQHTVIEVLPASTLRALGLPYLHTHGSEMSTGSANARTEERLTIVTKLSDALAAYGLRVEMPRHIAHACVDDSEGHCLDAVLALVTVYLATRGAWGMPPTAPRAVARAQLEGWIVRVV